LVYGQLRYSMTRKWAERFFSLFLMTVAVTVYWKTFELPQTADKTGILTGPAFFPQWLAIVLFICSAVPFAKSILHPSEALETLTIPHYKTFLKLVVFLSLIVGAMVIIPYTGWLPAQLALVFLTEIIFEKRRLTHSFLIAFGAMMVIYALFELALGYRLPRSMFLE